MLWGAQDGNKQYPQRMRILVVEDDENTCALIISMLHRLDPGFEIEVAAGGDAGLKSYLRSFHDLVITDHAHPGLLGIELVEVIRQKNPAQPIILQTGNRGVHADAFRKRHKDIAFLEKPFRPQQLLDMVSAISSERRGGL
jgi:DNA-binding NtrC family response regulator